MDKLISSAFALGLLAITITTSAWSDDFSFSAGVGGDPFGSSFGGSSFGSSSFDLGAYNSFSGSSFSGTSSSGFNNPGLDLGLYNSISDPSAFDLGYSDPTSGSGLTDFYGSSVLGDSYVDYSAQYGYSDYSSPAGNPAAYDYSTPGILSGSDSGSSASGSTNLFAVAGQSSSSLDAWRELDITTAAMAKPKASPEIDMERGNFEFVFEPVPLYVNESELNDFKKSLKTSAMGKSITITNGLIALTFGIESNGAAFTNPPGFEPDFKMAAGLIAAEINSTLNYPYTAPEDINCINKLRDKYIATRDSLLKWAGNNSDRAELDLPALEISVSTAYGVRAKDDYGNPVWITYDYTGAKISIKDSQGQVTTMKMSEFISAGGLSKFANEGGPSSFVSAYNTTVATEQWSNAVGSDALVSASIENPGMTQRVIEGTSLWMNTYGSKAVGDSIASDSSGTLKLVNGTAIAAGIFGQAAVEQVIAENPDKAKKVALALDAAKTAGYSDADIATYIQANPDTWYNPSEN